MGFGKFFTLPSSSSSSSSSSRPQGSYRPPSSPGSSKADYASGLGSSNVSVPNWSAQSYDPCDGDAPPAYSPKKSDFDGWVADLKIPEPHELRADTFYNPADYGGEDPLLPLKYYDIVIILDDSHSMTARDNPQGISRWDQAWTSLVTLVVVGAKYDQDGIDIHFLNNRGAHRVVKNASDLIALRKSVGEPHKDTHSPTGDVLETLLLKYRKQISTREGRLRTKKRLFIVITDGEASDSPEEGIVDAAIFLQKNEFPTSQVGIQFLQVGNDQAATRFLEELDQGLKSQLAESLRDMVDTVKSNGPNLTGPRLIKALTGGFNRLQDRVGE